MANQPQDTLADYIAWLRDQGVTNTDAVLNTIQDPNASFVQINPNEDPNPNPNPNGFNASTLVSGAMAIPGIASIFRGQAGITSAAAQAQVSAAEAAVARAAIAHNQSIAQFGTGGSVTASTAKDLKAAQDALTAAKEQLTIASRPPTALAKFKTNISTKLDKLMKSPIVKHAKGIAAGVGLFFSSFSIRRQGANVANVAGTAISAAVFFTYLAAYVGGPIAAAIVAGVIVAGLLFGKKDPNTKALEDGLKKLDETELSIWHSGAIKAIGAGVAASLMISLGPTTGDQVVNVPASVVASLNSGGAMVNAANGQAARMSADDGAIYAITDANGNVNQVFRVAGRNSDGSLRLEVTNIKSGVKFASSKRADGAFIPILKTSGCPNGARTCFNDDAIRNIARGNQWARQAAQTSDPAYGNYLLDTAAASNKDVQ